MNYGTEYGQAVVLNSKNGHETVVCKAWYFSDHIIGVEIEQSHFKESVFEKLKLGFKRQLDNYELIWTERL